MLVVGRDDVEPFMSGDGGTLDRLAVEGVRESSGVGDNVGRTGKGVLSCTSSSAARSSNSSE